jgi:Rieske Fe-S protein
MKEDLELLDDASRRSFLKQFGTALAGVTVIGSLAPVLEGCYSSNPVATVTLQGKTITEDVSALTADNTAIHVAAKSSPTGSPWLVIRRSATIYETIVLVCKHQGCKYPDIDYNGTNIACSCHGSQYDRDGHVTHGPATSNLDTYVTDYDATTNSVTIHY